MILVYTHPSIVLVSQARQALEAAGIECFLRNEYAAGAIGELAPIDTWPELWIAKDHQYQHARSVIGASQAGQDESDWKCGSCGKSSPATFDWCWNCAAEKRTVGPS